MSAIEWCDETLQLCSGCDPVSPGCRVCYSARLCGTRLKNNARTRGLVRKTRDGRFVFNGVVRCHEDQLEKPLHWKKPRRIFVADRSDLFHPKVPDAFLDKSFGVMALCPQHTFQVLTKRAQRLRKYTSDPAVAGRIWDAAVRLDCEFHLPESHPGYRVLLDGAGFRLPLPNVWAGASAEDQARWNERREYLRETPAAVRFASLEPLLGPIYLGQNIGDWLDQVIVGSESGPGARDCDLAWVRDLRDQCVRAGVAFFFKQHVERGRKISLPELDGRRWAQIPETRATLEAA